MYKKSVFFLIQHVLKRKKEEIKKKAGYINKKKKERKKKERKSEWEWVSVQKIESSVWVCKSTVI